MSTLAALLTSKQHLHLTATLYDNNLNFKPVLASFIFFVLTRLVRAIWTPIIVSTLCIVFFPFAHKQKIGGRVKTRTTDVILHHHSL